MKHPILTTTKVLGLAVLALLLAACNPVENKSESQSLLTVESISGSDADGNESSFLQSDVLYQDPATGASSIFADTAKVTLTARTLDPAPALGTSPYADIQVTKYVVSFSRSDGKNTPGVDVPYSFEGNISILVKIGMMTSIGFVIVRETAKQESPLIELGSTGTRAEVLATTARIDFYGHDLGNKNVKATAYLPVYFGNYANKSGN